MSKIIKQSIGKYLHTNKGLQKSRVKIKSSNQNSNTVRHELIDGTIITHHLNKHGAVDRIEVRKDGEYHKLEHGDPKESGKGYLISRENILYHTGELLQRVGYEPSTYSEWD